MNLDEIQRYNKRCIDDFCKDFFEAFGETPGKNWARAEKEVREGRYLFHDLKEGDVINYKHSPREVKRKRRTIRRTPKY